MFSEDQCCLGFAARSSTSKQLWTIPDPIQSIPASAFREKWTGSISNTGFVMMMLTPICIMIRANYQTEWVWGDINNFEKMTVKGPKWSWNLMIGLWTARNIDCFWFQGSSGCQNLYRARFVSLESQKRSKWKIVCRTDRPASNYSKRRNIQI